MFDKAKQVYELQKKAKAIQKDLRETEIEAGSNDGFVRVVFNGEQHLVEVSIDENALKPENKKALENDFKNTISQAIARSQALAAEKTKEMMGDMNLNIPGLS
jgi:DNA-binding YbaB/EbfC family protein